MDTKAAEADMFLLGGLSAIFVRYFRVDRCYGGLLNARLTLKSTEGGPLIGPPRAWIK